MCTHRELHHKVQQRIHFLSEKCYFIAANVTECKAQILSHFRIEKESTDSFMAAELLKDYDLFTGLKFGCQWTAIIFKEVILKGSCICTTAEREMAGEDNP